MKIDAVYVPASEAASVAKRLARLELEVADKKPWWSRWWWRRKVRRHWGGALKGSPS